MSYARRPSSLRIPAQRILHELFIRHLGRLAAAFARGAAALRERGRRNAQLPPLPPKAALPRILTLLLPATLVIGGIAAYIRHAELTRLHVERAEHGLAAVIAGVGALSGPLQWARGDLRYLADHQRTRRLADADIDDRSRLAHVAATWIAFSRARQVYDQIRWIDETGMERLRIDVATPDPVRTPDHALQDKRNRYYFTETNRLPDGDLFVSPLDLNIEGGAIEIPIVPTIRLATPVSDSSGARRGIIILNFDATDMLARFAAVSANAGKQAWLTNSDGFWLKGPRAEEEWGFMRGRQQAGMQSRYPRAWEIIRSKTRGQFAGEEGLWTFETVYPLLEATAPAAVHPAAQADARNYAWKVISLIPADEYNAGMAEFDAKLAGGTLAVLILLFVATSRLVRIQMAEKALAQALAQSNAQLRRLSGYDELARERERKQFARELHDRLGQNLLAVRMELSSLKSGAAHVQPALPQRAGELLNHLDATIASVRSMMNALRPATLELGLYAAADWQLRQIERIKDVRCTLEATEEDFDASMDETQTLVLFRCLQDYLFDIVDHSGANEIHVGLQRQDRDIVMTVADNGTVPRAVARPAGGTKPPQMTLVRIGERIRPFEGQLSLGGRPGGGTVLSISIVAAEAAIG